MAPSEVDVLPRHRLLLEAHGFEGLGLVHVEAHLSDQALVEPEHVGNGRVERDAARAPACLQISEDEHGVAEVADVRRLDTRPPQRARLVPEPAQSARALPAPVTAPYPPPSVPDGP